jgi:hypothetical protein
VKQVRQAFVSGRIFAFELAQAFSYIALVSAARDIRRGMEPREPHSDIARTVGAVELVVVVSA